MSAGDEARLRAEARLASTPAAKARVREAAAEHLAVAGSADPFALAADLLDPPGGGVDRFYDDPAGFVHTCIRWDQGEGPASYQAEIMATLVEKERVCVRGPHTLGKTALNAWLILWFALTRDARGIDWKVITTASAWRQLEKFLWPEVRKWSMRLRWGTIGRQPFTPTEMMRLGLRLTHGEAVAAACEDPATIEGAHADSLMYVYDEAKTIPPETFDASEGAFMGAGADTKQEAFAIACSTPGIPEGRFHAIQTRQPGTEDWAVRAVSKEETISSGRLSAERAKARQRQWGTDSAVYINRVEGNFASSEKDGVIPLEWVEKAIERWMIWASEDVEVPDHATPPWPAIPTARAPMPGVHAARLDSDEPLARALTCMGVDVAEEGGDRTIFALRYELMLGELRRCPRGDVMQATGFVQQVLNGTEGNPPVVVDAIGLGAGVAARLREREQIVIAFKASEKTAWRDRSGELEFFNVRSAAWWRMRELLDPANGYAIGLPPDDELIGDLTAPKWAPHSSGKILVEPKDKLRDRLGRSTDTGDAVVQAYWYGVVGVASAPILKRREGGSRWGPMAERLGDGNRGQGAGALARA